MLHEFIATHRDVIVSRCRERVVARANSSHIAADSKSGVPVFLDQLVNTLRSSGQASPDIGTTAAVHGHELLINGFTVSQVVHGYGDVCQSITALAIEERAPIDTADFRTLNRCLDEAIASAVTAYWRESEQLRLDGQARCRNQRMGFFIHELRNLVNTAIVAFAVLKSGVAGVGGSTGAVLERSLAGLQDLITRSLDEVRLAAGIQNREQISVSAFMNELKDAAALEANARGRKLTVAPVDPALTIDVDQKVLSAVVVNLVQNGFKFSPPGSAVTVRVGGGADRVLIEVEDECGGLGGGDCEALFRPFEQRGADRSGVGIGLTFSRWGAEANNGRLYARNLPGKGCIFTVDLPRASTSA